MENVRRLVVIRHAKAETFAASDAERALTDRGRGDAAALGDWLAGQGVQPHAVYVSTALRTRQTWDQVAAAAGWTAEPTFDGYLYGTDEEGVLELVRATPDDVATVVVIAHNPTLALVVQLLDDGEGEGSTEAAVRGFPTSAAAVFELSAPWAQIDALSGRLTAFHVGRG